MDKKSLNNFIYKACRELGEKKRYSEIHSELQKALLGAWRFGFYALLIVDGLLLYRVLRTLVVERRLAGTLLIYAFAGIAVTPVFFLLVKKIRSGSGAELQQLSILHKSAEELAARLKEEQPESDLLDYWKQVKPEGSAKDLQAENSTDLT